MIKFIADINKYIQDRAARILARKSDLEGLISQLQAKNEQIKLQEDQYKQSLDETIVATLNVLKSEAATINADIENTRDIISLMASKESYQYDDEKLASEIDSYIEGLNIANLKLNIEDAKAAYIQALETYSDTMSQLSNNRSSFTKVEDAIDKENKLTIVKSFNKHLLCWDKAFGINARDTDLGIENNTYTANIYNNFRGQI